MMADKILFILKLPPPVHGSTLMNGLVAKSELLNKRFIRTVLPLSISKNTEDIGKWSFRKLGTTVRDYLRLFKQLRTARPDLVYMALSPVSFAFLKDFIFVLIVRMTGVPLVFHLHGKGISRYAGRLLYKALYRITFNGAHAIVLAKELAYDVEGLGLRKIHVVPNGIESCVSHAMLNMESFRKGEQINLLFLSNFVRAKGIMLFLESCALLKKMGIPFTMTIVGREIDVDKEEIMVYVRDRGIGEHLLFLGAAYGEEKRRFLLRNDLLIFPTAYPNECFPLVVLEAMECGLCVVSSREGGIPSIINDGQNGILLETLTGEAIALKVAALYGRPEVVAAMRARTRMDFESRFTAAHFENKLAETLETILVTRHEVA